MTYLITDIETQVAKGRILKTEQPPRELPIDTAVKQVLDRICADKGQTADRSCFVPARLHEPVCIVALLVDDQLRYMTHAVMAPEAIGGSPNVGKLIHDWWTAFTWMRDQYHPTLVTFNGVHFDLPVLEVTGFEHGCRMPHINPLAKVWEDVRTERSPDRHLDLFSYLARPGVLGGNLSFWTRLIGLPGKLDTAGDMVQQMLEQKKLSAIADYCCIDVLNSYGLLWHVLYQAGLMPTNWRGRDAVTPDFLAAAEKVCAGRGPETARFLNAIQQVPF